MTKEKDILRERSTSRGVVVVSSREGACLPQSARAKEQIICKFYFEEMGPAGRI